MVLCFVFGFSTLLLLYNICILEQLWKLRDNFDVHEDVAEKFFSQSRSKWPKSMKCRWYSKYSSHSSTQLQHHFWRVIIFFFWWIKKTITCVWLLKYCSVAAFATKSFKIFLCFKIFLIFGSNSQMSKIGWSMHSNSKFFKTSIALPASWTGVITFLADFVVSWISLAINNSD